ncbi:MAG: hypothetical protein WCR67_00880 [Bacilli bacterium]
MKNQKLLSAVGYLSCILGFALFFNSLFGSLGFIFSLVFHESLSVDLVYYLSFGLYVSFSESIMDISFFVGKSVELICGLALLVLSLFVYYCKAKEEKKTFMIVFKAVSEFAGALCLVLTVFTIVFGYFIVYGLSWYLIDAVVLFILSILVFALYVGILNKIEKKKNNPKPLKA